MKISASMIVLFMCTLTMSAQNFITYDVGKDQSRYMHMYYEKCYKDSIPVYRGMLHGKTYYECYKLIGDYIPHGMDVLALNQMGERFMNDCEKQNYQGYKEYWDFTIDCSQIEKIPNMTINNSSE